MPGQCFSANDPDVWILEALSIRCGSFLMHTYINITFLI